ncbi:hypothetical protein DCC85_09775 [Paenibacillus sp. CAA11]|uniref:NusG domain II-containing protein n=1 Tax=Paenibacillus sp. CAA11 TaxID=1532905 RepID=UPI000D3334B9|nr:NusG domain II-containing protein [Paenibacillus sp. CAA11]AWB44486.1 hypothetical protein DCC85_09775 [Paenibacillus sp. CAA11]
MFKLKRADWILVVAVLVIVGGVLGGRALFYKAEAFTPGEMSAKIMLDGELYKLVKLTKEEQVIEMYTEYGHDTLKVYNEGIQMTYSDTPRKIGVKMGFISKPGERIICVPHRILVDIVHDGDTPPTENEVDAVVN